MPIALRYVTTRARRDARKVQNTRMPFSIMSDVPRFESATVQCGIPRGNSYDVDCRCSRCSRFPPALTFPLIFIFFPIVRSNHSSLLTCVLLLCVVVAKWLWITACVWSHVTRSPIQEVSSVDDTRPQKRSDSLKASKLQFSPQWRF